MTFNLSAPQGFRGLDHTRPIRRYERHLPHWRQEGATYFATFNLADAVPANIQQAIESIKRDWEHKTRQTRDERSWRDFAKRVYKLAERALDAGYGKCWFRKPLYFNELHRSLMNGHNQRYELGCYVIMANHCHVAIRPYCGIELEDELGAIKRATSRYINEHEGGSGPLWTQESYDRIIRDEEHLYRVVQYIGNNPRKAKVPKDRWQRWINPEWEKTGWKFEEARSLRPSSE